MGVKKTLVLLDSLAIGLALVINFTLGSAKAISVGGPTDCSANSVINCGAHSTDALISAYDSSSYVQKVYAYFGVSSAMIHNLNATNQVGFVTKDNQVFIGGQGTPVAIGAVTAGRENISGSTQVNFEGITFFKRPPSVSFAQSTLPAFVSMQNGRFDFAVLASCGNVVIARPVVKPAPKPAPTPTQTPTPQTPPAPTPTINNTNNNVNVQNQSQSQSQQVVVNQPPQAQTQSSTSAQASTPATTSSASTQTSAQPVATTQPTSLPNTGPGDILGIFGVSSLLGLAGHRFYLTRRRA